MLTFDRTVDWPRLRALCAPLKGPSRASLPDELVGLGGHFLDRFSLFPIGHIPLDGRFFPVQRRANHLRVLSPGRGSSYRVDQLGVGVRANMGFHPEVPLVALAGLMHLGITPLQGAKHPSESSARFR